MAEQIATELAAILVGLFFTFSGFHKLFNTSRHQSLVATLKDCGVPFIAFNQWFVPLVECLGGLGVAFFPYLIAFSYYGLTLQMLSAFGLITICIVACLTDGRKRVAAYQPIDLADRIDDWLYLPEILYIILLVLVVV